MGRGSGMNGERVCAVYWDLTIKFESYTEKPLSSLGLLLVIHADILE
jgi:hypothetical protein